MKTNKGFSLLELLVVITLITALSAIAAPSILDLFQGRALSQAFNILDGAFMEARSHAISSRKETAVYMTYRSTPDNPPVKIWVVSGGDLDQDTSGPLQGLAIDDRDQVLAAGLTYDDHILSSKELPETIYLHGLAFDDGSYDSAAQAPTGHFSRWYCVFRPDGTGIMVMPDGDNGTDGGASNWQAVNDYLPIDFDSAAGSPADDTNITLSKAKPDDFEDTPEKHYDLKLRDSLEDLYIHFQTSTGKLIRRRFVDTITTTP